ncbi:MAG TPA: phosphate ABC transporter permease PstA [Dehalococcoidia bacterium]|nr:phosphate ABC transporter permease PstA [Dehalococcoidia bacterium]
MYLRRKLTSYVMLGLTVITTGASLVFLFFILGYVLAQGIAALNWDFFTQIPKPVGEPGGGMANAIVGTLILMAIAVAVGLPMGIGAGVYLAEYNGRLSGPVRFLTDVLVGVPSIIIGIFVYTIVVLPMRSFSALAGGIALGIIMVPTVTRATEEMLRLVPSSLREASLALGVPWWRTIVSVVIPTAMGGIMTGVMLAVARIAGETAPLLFTAFGNRFWSLAPDQPIAAIPLQVFTYAISPYADWRAQAWAGSFVLVVMILITNVVARVFTSRTGRRI